MYPCIPIKCFELSILYSSCSPEWRDKLETGRSALQQAALGNRNNRNKEGTLNRVTCNGDCWPVMAYLARRIDYLRSKILSAMFDDLGEMILNGWIVAVDKVTLNELHRERGFA